VKILLFYEMVPECTKIYVLDVDSDTANKISLCHNHYINTVQFDRACPPVKDACNWLNEWLAGKQPITLEDSKPIDGPFCDFVVVTGFLM